MKALDIEDMLNDKGSAILPQKEAKMFLRITIDEYIKQAIAGDIEDVGVIVEDLVAMIQLIDEKDWEWVYLETNPMSASNLHILEAGIKA